MAKKMSICFRDHVFRDYIENYNGNKSAYIEDMFLTGIDSQSADLPHYKNKVIELNTTLREKDEEIKKLLAEIGRNRKNNQQIIITDDQAENFKANLERNHYKKSWFKQTLKVLKNDMCYFDGRHKLYNNEFGENINSNGFASLIQMAQNLEKEGFFDGIRLN